MLKIRKIRNFILLLFPLSVSAQWVPIPSTSFPALDAILNAKPAMTTGAGAPVSSCTVAKDLYVNQGNGHLYICSPINVWVDISTGSVSSVTAVAPLASSGGSNPAISISNSSGSGAVVLVTNPTINSPVLVNPNLGTPSAGVLTNATGLPLTTGTTGTLPVNKGGTGVTTAQGNGSKVQLSTGTTTLNDCVKFDANGNTVDAGAACGSGGGGGTGRVIFTSNSPYSGSIPAAIAALTGSIGTVVVDQSYSSAATITIPSNVQVVCTPGVTVTQTNNSNFVFFSSSTTTIGLSGCKTVGGSGGFGGFGLNFWTIENNQFTGWHNQGIAIGAVSQNGIITGNGVYNGGSGCVDGVFMQDIGFTNLFSDNLVDNSGCSDHAVAFHSFAGGISNLTIHSNNIISGGPNFALEVTQNASGTVLTGISITDNHFYFNATGNGCVSLGGAKGASIANNQCNLNGTLPGIGQYEIVDSNNITVTGNTGWGGLAGSNGIVMDTSFNSSVTGNTVEGKQYDVTSGGHGGNVNISNVTWENNVFTVPASTTGNGFIVQCNVGSCTGNNTRILGNTFIGVGATNSPPVRIQNDLGTIDGTQVQRNVFQSYTGGVSISAGVTNTDFGNAGDAYGLTRTSATVLNIGANPQGVQAWNTLVGGSVSAATFTVTSGTGTVLIGVSGGDSGVAVGTVIVVHNIVGTCAGCTASSGTVLPPNAMPIGSWSVSGGVLAAAALTHDLSTYHMAPVAAGTNCVSPLASGVMQISCSPPAQTFSTLTDAATITWAVASSQVANATVTLGGNRTLALTGLVNGGSYVLKVVQNGSGNWGLTLGSGCTWKVSGGGSGAITPSTAAGSIDVLAFTYDGTSCYANFQKNFN